MLRKEPALRLLGYTQTANGYQVLPPNERGWLWLTPTRTWLGVEQNEIVCYDEEGNPLGDYRAVAEALAVETQARVEAERRAQTAEARLRELEAERDRLRQSRS